VNAQKNIIKFELNIESKTSYQEWKIDSFSDILLL
jgi:hypothetical protein